MCATTCGARLVSEWEKYRPMEHQRTLRTMDLSRMKMVAFLFLMCKVSSDDSLCPSAVKVNTSCGCSEFTSTYWSQDCYTESQEHDYRITHKQSTDGDTQNYISVVKIECHKDMPYRPGMFYNATMYNTARFTYNNCPFPNIPFEQLSGDVKLLELVCTYAVNFSGELNSSAFLGLQDFLKRLTFTNNQITQLSEEVFYNLTGLVFLSLKDNKLRTLPRMLFARQSKLRTLDLSNNRIEYLPEKIFESLIHLHSLYMYKNSLEILPPKIFQDLVSLKWLELSLNRLRELSEDTFKGLPQLNNTSLSQNRLKTFPENIFHPLTKSYYLDLSSNPLLGTLPDDLLMGMKSLRKFKVTNCSLTNISERFFSYSEHLMEIDLKDNKLHHLPVDIFRNNTNLTRINLDNNRLESLPEAIFSNNLKLERIELSENKLSTLPSKLFDNLKNMKMLSIRSNNLSVIKSNNFRDLGKLKELYLSNNSITYFNLGFNEKIEKIDLSLNNLTSVPNLDWIQYLQLNELNFEYNQIRNVEIPLIYHNPVKLLFGNNNISNVTVNNVVIQTMFSDNSDINIIVDLYPNPLVCDCNMAEFFRYASDDDKNNLKYVQFRNFNKLRCAKPAEIAGMKMIDLIEQNFTCPCNQSYPSVCRCTQLYDKATLNCIKRNMSALPEEIPNNTKVLHFEDNLLTSVAALSDPMWRNVEVLHLDNNRIESLEGWTNISSKLKILSLQGNKLAHLTPYFRNYTSLIRNLSLTLGDNPWECSCQAVKMKAWLIQNSFKVKDFKSVHCSWSPNGSDVLIATASDEFLCPVDYSAYKVQLISITTVCVILAMLLFVVSVLYYRNKQTVIAYVYIHLHNFFVCFFSEEDMDEDKIFDAFVSYSSTDRDVALSLINELEKKDPPFRLCIHERDWLPGNLITWNIVNSVQNSKRTILVLSKDFLDSMWFQVEFHTAYYQMLEDRIDRLIVIVKGELPPKDSLDKDLQYLISTKTYLIWGERWMWEKLRYAMPHRKHVLPAPTGLALGYKPNSEMLKNVENQISILSSEKNEHNKKVQQNGNAPMVTSGKEVSPSNNNKPLRPVFKGAKVVATARV